MHGPEMVVRLFEGREATGRRLYDASCGDGASSRALSRLGFEVVGSTLGGAPAPAPGMRCLEGVDLNRRIPFEDGSFDAAVLQEVVEHLENPAHVVREFNRILRPGGLWALSTPNASCLRSRVHYLFSGFTKGRRRPANYNVPPGDYTNLFIPSLPTLHYLLWQYGFRVVRTGRSARKWVSLLLLPILFVPLLLSTLYYTRPPRKYDSPLQREASRDLRRLLLSRHVLLDENLVLLLEKRRGLGGLYVPEEATAASSFKAGSIAPLE